MVDDGRVCTRLLVCRHFVVSDGGGRRGIRQGEEGLRRSVQGLLKDESKVKGRLVMGVAGKRKEASLD